VQSLHERKGVNVPPGQTIARLSAGTALLSSGGGLEPTSSLLALVFVRQPISAAGRSQVTAASRERIPRDSAPEFLPPAISRWPDPYTSEQIQVEHWVVAERRGRVAARNARQRERFDAVPFFWSQHYDVSINYVGHAEKWDGVRIDGTLESRDCAVTYTRDGRTLAVATIFRDRQSLQAEIDIEREISSIVRRQNVSSTI
jgi:hypothetical protein